MHWYLGICIDVDRQNVGFLPWAHACSTFPLQRSVRASFCLMCQGLQLTIL